MISAALNYGKYCRDRDLEERYIKHPATFLGKDKPFEEFIFCVPEKTKKEGTAKNVTDAMRIYEKSQSVDFSEVQLW